MKALFNITPLTSILLISACHQAADKPAVPPPPEVFVSQPVQRTVTDWEEFTGRFEARDSVDVRARVSGYLDKVAFRDGEIVRRGQLLFIIDPRPYTAVVTQAQGALDQAEARANYARTQLQRARELVTTDAIAKSTVDQRTQDYQAAQAGIVSAQGALDQAKLNLQFTRVYAPLAGRISRKLVSEGNLVAGGDANATLLTTIVSVDPIDLYFDADEKTYLKYTRLRLSGKIPNARDKTDLVKVALSDETAPSRVGKLDFVENRLERSTGTLRGRAVLSNANGALTPGQFARVQVVVGAPYPALLVPETAISNDQSRKIVFVVDPEGRAKAAPVTLGRLFGR
jgi:RND family efflux transporter MFP subunit